MEEKKLRKSKKREEKLKKREEELKRQEDLARQSQERKLKRQKEQASKQCNNTNHWSTSSEKYFRDDTHIQYIQQSNPALRSNTLPNCQKIPRFERQRAVTSVVAPSSTIKQRRTSSFVGGRSTTDALTIKCPSNHLSASCSSLSSLSSGTSDASNSPPLSVCSSPPPPKSPWKLPVQNISASPLWMPGAKENCPPAVTTTAVESPAVVVVSRSGNMLNKSGRALKCYTNVRPVKTKTGLPSDSCSLFSSSSGEVGSLFSTSSGEIDLNGTQELQPDICGNEYSLFGPNTFGGSLMKSM